MKKNIQEMNILDAKFNVLPLVSGPNKLNTDSDIKMLLAVTYLIIKTRNNLIVILYIPPFAYKLSDKKPNKQHGLWLFCTNQ